MNKEISKPALQGKALFCFTLIIIDFVLSFIGITLGVISEANPFLIFLFEMEFLPALFIRFLMAFGIYLLFTFSVKLAKPHQIKMVAMAINFSVCVNLFIMLLHGRWIVLSYTH